MSAALTGSLLQGHLAGCVVEVIYLQDGAFLARQGDVANCIFFVEEGTVQIYHTMNKEVADSDDEDGDEEEVHSQPPVHLSELDSCSRIQTAQAGGQTQWNAYRGEWTANATSCYCSP